MPIDAIFYTTPVLLICLAIGVFNVVVPMVLSVRKNEPCDTCWHDAKTHKPKGLGRCQRCGCRCYERPASGDVEYLRELDRGRSDQ